MLLEFAAKQQLLCLGHVFTDRLTGADGVALDDLSVAIDAVLAGTVSGVQLRALLLHSGDGTGNLFRDAVGDLGDGPAGMALGLAYLPVEFSDTVARHLLAPIGLKTAAQRIDPRGSLSLRTRLFVADRLLKTPSLQGLLSGVSAVVALQANGLHPDWSELAEASLRPRLLRLRETVQVLRTPAVFAGALSACLRADWQGAEQRLGGVQAGEEAADPPLLADLFAVSLLPSCDTLDAVQRLRGRVIGSDSAERRFVWDVDVKRQAGSASVATERRSDASLARARGAENSGISAISASEIAPST